MGTITVLHNLLTPLETRVDYVVYRSNKQVNTEVLNGDSKTRYPCQESKGQIPPPLAGRQAGPHTLLNHEKQPALPTPRPRYVIWGTERE